MKTRFAFVWFIVLWCLGMSANRLAAQGSLTSYVTKLGVDLDVRSGSRVLADDLSSQVILPDGSEPVSGGSTVPQIQFRGGNVQVNDSTQDFVQIFPGFRPFVHATQSEVSTAAFGKNIVVTFNDSTGFHVSRNPGGPGLIVDRVRLSSFAVSNDGGQTFNRGSMPPPTNGKQTFGDPSVGVGCHCGTVKYQPESAT